MTSEAAAILDAVGDKTSVLVRRASFVSVDTDGRALVNLGTSQFPVVFTGGLVPEPNETVSVLTVGDSSWLLGPTAPKPGVGTVASITAPLVKVTTAVGVVEMPYVGAAPAVGDLVAIVWSQGPRCVGKLSTSTNAAQPGSPGSESGARSATFRVVDTGSTDRGSARWWTDQPWASDSTYGAWFYGSQVKDTIPAAATLVSLKFYVSYVQRQGGAPRFALHNQQGKGALPSFAAYDTWDAPAGWQTPPMAQAWFDALKAGGAYQGVGLDQGGYNKFSSRAQDGLTGALDISWKV